MKRLLSSAAILAAILLPFAPQPAAAQGYQIDCAILLCLAGGWPPSVPCARARAEFIRRITPWPIEPPLQIWRCPMRAAQNVPDPVQRLFRLAGMDADPRRSFAPEIEQLYLAQAVGLGADIDVSDPAFDFIRSIDVFDVHLDQREVGKEGDCRRVSNLRQGTYDATGQFRWHDSSLSALPPEFIGDERFGEHCPNVWVRAVFVDWNDSEGDYGFEQVNY